MTAHQVLKSAGFHSWCSGCLRDQEHQNAPELVRVQISSAIQAHKHDLSDQNLCSTDLSDSHGLGIKKSPSPVLKDSEAMKTES